MELQRIPLEIAVRPGSENIVADYLSRNPEAKFDEEVNSEDAFEDKIYVTESTQSLPAKIAEEQSRDPVIEDSLRQPQ